MYDLKDIDIRYNERAVHVGNDQILKEYMGYSLGQAIEVAKFIRRTYRRKYHCPLRITTLSLAVELEGHFVLYEISLKCKQFLERIPLKLVERGSGMRFCNWMIRHMEVIDCGELADDNNRFLWDFLSQPVKFWLNCKKRL